MLLQRFKISKCKANVDKARMMDVSLSFSQGDMVLQLRVCFIFLWQEWQESEESDKQARVSLSSFTTGNSTHRHYCSGDIKVSRALGRGQRQGQWVPVQPVLGRYNICDLSC